MPNIRQNLAFAFLYNALGVPIAAGVLYPFFGILLSPMIASLAMTFSSVSVIFNALRPPQIVAPTYHDNRDRSYRPEAYVDGRESASRASGGPSLLLREMRQSLDDFGNSAIRDTARESGGSQPAT